MTVRRVRPLDPTQVSEKLWQRTLVEGFETFGYLVNHVYPLATKTGYRTSTTLKGWPDLTAIGTGSRAGYLVFVECKGPKTPIDADQLVVLDALARSEDARCWLLRPASHEGMREIVEWMRDPASAPVRYGFDAEMVARAKGR